MSQSNQDKQEAVDALDRATTLIYNIAGDRWQMAYEVLEALIANLRVEVNNQEQINRS
jgi:hypothetical protein